MEKERDEKENMHAEERAALRKRILAARDRLPVGERAAKSLAIAGRLWALPVFAEAKSILVYVNFRSEVETLPLIRDCLARGKAVSVPLTVTAGRRLEAYSLADPDRDLVPGYCRIPEPAKGLPLVAPAGLEVVIVPGSVFDAQGGRLGYGGGYYDRFLGNEAARALRIGLAYDLQVIRRVPVEAHDQRLHYLVTETRTIHVGSDTPCAEKPRF
ncbi:5-formyltetrahydrofolate cyclo-ligase [Thiovibrio sp. JS02]